MLVEKSSKEALEYYIKGKPVTALWIGEDGGMNAMLLSDILDRPENHFLVDVPTVVCLLVSLLVMCLGNIMPKFRMNWYCGLKTPWTLSSETVWTKTHRVAGRMLFAAGIIGAAGSFVPNEIAKFVLVLAPMAAATIIPTVLSWRWYRAEQQ